MEFLVFFFGTLLLWTTFYRFTDVKSITFQMFVLNIYFLLAKRKNNKGVKKVIDYNNIVDKGRDNSIKNRSFFGRGGNRVGNHRCALLTKRTLKRKVFHREPLVPFSVKL